MIAASDGEGRMLGSLSDAILVQRSVDGDAEAFGAIVRRHSSLMRAYVARIVGSQSDADDVVQEAFVTAWKQLPALRDPAAVKAWLMRIASRQAFSYVRSRPKDVDIDGYEVAMRGDTQPDSVAIHREQLRAVSRALDALPDDQRRCWLLREVAGLSYAEIATDMGIPASTVRGTLARARSSITIQMEGWR